MGLDIQMDHVAHSTHNIDEEGIRSPTEAGIIGKQSALRRSQEWSPRGRALQQRRRKSTDGYLNQHMNQSPTAEISAGPKLQAISAPKQVLPDSDEEHQEAKEAVEEKNSNMANSYNQNIPPESSEPEQPPILRQGRAALSSLVSTSLHEVVTVPTFTNKNQITAEGTGRSSNVLAKQAGEWVTEDIVREAEIRCSEAQEQIKSLEEILLVDASELLVEEEHKLVQTKLKTIQRHLTYLDKYAEDKCQELRNQSGSGGGRPNPRLNLAPPPPANVAPKRATGILDQRKKDMEEVENHRKRVKHLRSLFLELVKHFRWERSKRNETETKVQELHLQLKQQASVLRKAEKQVEQLKRNPVAATPEPKPWQKPPHIGRKTPEVSDRTSQTGNNIEVMGTVQEQSDLVGGHMESGLVQRLQGEVALLKQQLQQVVETRSSTPEHEHRCHRYRETAHVTSPRDAALMLYGLDRDLNAFQHICDGQMQPKASTHGNSATTHVTDVPVYEHFRDSHIQPKADASTGTHGDPPATHGTDTTDLVEQSDRSVTASLSPTNENRQFKSISEITGADLGNDAGKIREILSGMDENRHETYSENKGCDEEEERGLAKNKEGERANAKNKSKSRFYVLLAIPLPLFLLLIIIIILLLFQLLKHYRLSQDSYRPPMPT